MHFFTFLNIKSVVRISAVVTAAWIGSTPCWAAETTEAARPKSTFEEKLRHGRDPFFPNSARRIDRAVSSTTKPVVSPIVQLSLKGVSGPAEGRLALINNKTFAAGEEGYVKVPNGQIKITVHEIRAGSVTVTVEGENEKKEIKLREGL